MGLDADSAQCAAGRVNQLSDQTISHVVLAVTSTAADAAIGEALAAC